MLLRRSRTSSDNLSRRVRRKFDSAFLKKILYVILAIGLFFVLKSLLTIKKIDCLLDGSVCDEILLNRLNKNLGSYITSVNQKVLIASIKEITPADEVKIGFKLFGTMHVELSGRRPPVPVMVYFVKNLPVLSLDTAPVSSESSWQKPSSEIRMFVDLASSSAYHIWDSGHMTPVSSENTAIKYIFSEKPSLENLQSIYKLIKIIQKYTSFDGLYLIGSRFFLSQKGQPDIIVSVPFDEDGVVEAFRSLNYLYSVKNDAKVIDLRFKNPIIR